MPLKNKIDWKNNPPSTIRVGLNINTSKLESITDGERSIIDGEFFIPLDPTFKKIFASGSDSINLVFNFGSYNYQKVKDEVIYIQRKKQDISGKYFTYSLKPQSS